MPGNGDGNFHLQTFVRFHLNNYYRDYRQNMDLLGNNRICPRQSFNIIGICLLSDRYLQCFISSETVEWHASARV